MKTDLVLRDVPNWFAEAVAQLATQIQADPRMYKMRTGVFFGCATDGELYMNSGVVLECSKLKNALKMCGSVRGAVMHAAVQLSTSAEPGSMHVSLGMMLETEGRTLQLHGVELASGGQPS